MGIFGFFSKSHQDPLEAHLNEYHRQQQRPGPTPTQQRESRRRGGGTSSSGGVSTRSNPTSRRPSRSGGRRKPCHVHSSSNGSNKGPSAASIAAALAAQQTGPLPNFFSFEQGSERAQGRYQNESTPLLGRFRAMPGGPGRRRESDDHQGLLSAGWRGSVHVGYGALMAAAAEGGGEFDESGSEEEDDSEGDGMLDSGFLGAGTIQERTLTRRVMVKKFNRARRRLYYTWVHPKASVIRRAVEHWWSRWFVLVVLPAFLVSWKTPELFCELRKNTDNRCVGRGLVRDTIPKIPNTRLRRRPRSDHTANSTWRTTRAQDPRSRSGARAGQLLVLPLRLLQLLQLDGSNMDHEGLQPIQSQLVAQIPRVSPNGLHDWRHIASSTYTSLCHPRTTLAYCSQHSMD